jgi:hypothetical protein
VNQPITIQLPGWLRHVGKLATPFIAWPALLMLGVWIGPHLPPIHFPSVTVAKSDAAALAMIHAHGSALHTAAVAIRGGNTIGDAQASFQKSFKQSLESQFARDHAPALDAILPSGTERTADQRVKYADALEAIAAKELAVK